LISPDGLRPYGFILFLTGWALSDAIGRDWNRLDACSASPSPLIRAVQQGGQVRFLPGSIRTFRHLGGWVEAGRKCCVLPVFDRAMHASRPMGPETL